MMQIVDRTGVDRGEMYDNKDLRLGKTAVEAGIQKQPDRVHRPMQFGEIFDEQASIISS